MGSQSVLEILGSSKRTEMIPGFSRGMNGSRGERKIELQASTLYLRADLVEEPWKTPLEHGVLAETSVQMVTLFISLIP